MNLLAACAGEGSPVRKFIFKSSAHVYGCAQDDPAFFTESMTPRAAGRRPRSSATSSRPRRRCSTSPASSPNVDVTVLRCANVLGPDVDDLVRAGCSRCRVVPMVLGFDPRTQFVHEDDVVHALEHAALHPLPGVFNVAADGVLALSEVIGLLGKRAVPVAAAVGNRACSPAPLRALGVRIPDEMLNQLRFGRGLDNRRYKASGFEYGYTTARDGARLLRAPAAAADPARRRVAATPTRARSSGSCAAARSPGRRSRARARRRGPSASRSASEL